MQENSKTPDKPNTTKEDTPTASLESLSVNLYTSTNQIPIESSRGVAKFNVLNNSLISAHNVSINTAEINQFSANTIMFAPPIPPPSIQLEELQEQLKYFYKNLYNKINRLFGPSLELSECCINLAIVPSKAQRVHEQNKLRNGTNRSQLYSSYEDIYSTVKKEAIKPEEIFKPRINKIPKRIAIIGRAGIGKSTFGQYLSAYLWALKNLWHNQFMLVFNIKLSNLTPDRYNRNSTLEDIIQTECLDRSGFTKTIDKNNLAATLQSFSDKTLIILDGWDEFNQLESPCTQIILGILNNPNLSVIVLTRPYTNLDLKYFDLQLECIGFTTENITTYMTYVFEDKTEIPLVSEFLIKHPAIHSLAHVPIILDMICAIWNNEILNLNRPVSMTELYQRIITKFWEAYKINQRKLFPRQSVNELNQKKEKTKEFLCLLAFNATNINCVMLNYELIKTTIKTTYQCSDEDITDYLEEILATGFLNTSNNNKITGNYYFPHLTIQEFLTALYWKKMYVSPDTITHENAKRFLKQIKYNQRFELVICFIAGLMENQEKLNSYFQLLIEAPRDILGIYELSLLMRCVDECLVSYNNNNDKLLEYFNAIVSFILNAFNTRKNRSQYNIIVSFLKSCQNILTSSKMINGLLERLIVENPLIRRINAFDLTPLGIINAEQVKSFCDLHGEKKIAGIFMNQAQEFPNFDDADDFITVEINHDLKQSPASENDDDDDKLDSLDRDHTTEQEQITLNTTQSATDLIPYTLDFNELRVRFYSTNNLDIKLHIIYTTGLSLDDLNEKHLFLETILQTEDLTLRFNAMIALLKLNYQKLQLLTPIIKTIFDSSGVEDKIEDLFEALSHLVNTQPDNLYLLATELVLFESIEIRTKTINLLNDLATWSVTKIVSSLKEILMNEKVKNVLYEAVKAICRVDKSALLELYLDNLSQKYFIKNKLILNWLIITRNALYIDSNHLCCYFSNQLTQLPITQSQAVMINRDIDIYYSTPLRIDLSKITFSSSNINSHSTETSRQSLTMIETTINKIISALKVTYPKVAQHDSDDDGNNITVDIKSDSTSKLLNYATYLSNSSSPECTSIVNEIYCEIAKRDITDPCLLIKLGYHLLATNNLLSAMICFDKILYLEDKETRKLAWNGKALISTKIDQMNFALFCTNQSLSLDHNHINTWQIRGDIFYTLEQFKSAIECYKHCLIINHAYKNCLNDLGMALWANSITADLPEAELYFELALKHKPHLPHLWCNRADTLLAQGKHEAAMHDYTNAIKLEENILSILKSMLYKLLVRNLYYTAFIYIYNIINNLSSSQLRSSINKNKISILLICKQILLNNKYRLTPEENDKDHLDDILDQVFEETFENQADELLSEKNDLNNEYTKLSSIERLRYSAQVCEELQNHKEALTYIEQAISINPKMIKLWECKGRLLTLMQLTSEAQQAFGQIHALQEESGNFQSNSAKSALTSSIFASLPSPPTPYLASTSVTNTDNSLTKESISTQKNKKNAGNANLEQPPKTKPRVGKK